MISAFGLNLDTTLAVAPDIVGVKIHFAFKFAAVATDEYPIALEMLFLRCSCAF